MTSKTNHWLWAVIIVSAVFLMFRFWLWPKITAGRADNDNPPRASASGRNVNQDQTQTFKVVVKPDEWSGSIDVPLHWGVVLDDLETKLQWWEIRFLDGTQHRWEKGPDGIWRLDGKALPDGSWWLSDVGPEGCRFWLRGGPQPEEFIISITP
jgi:hypothetical protein